MIPYIYLDFDGVLHPDKASHTVWHEGVPDVAGEDLFRWSGILVNVLDKHPAKIVINSRWRYLHSEEDILARLGELSRFVVGFADKSPGERYDVILRDVEARNAYPYLILDDGAADFPDECSELILCNPEMGIAEDGMAGRIARHIDFLSADVLE